MRNSGQASIAETSEAISLLSARLKQSVDGTRPDVCMDDMQKGLLRSLISELKRDEVPAE